MKRAAEFIGFCILLVLMALVAVSAFAPRFGWGIATVLSGSMEPKIQIGSIVISQPINPLNLKPGDIITFNSPIDQQLITHRVLSISDSNQIRFHTAGDANDVADQFEVQAGNVVGKVILTIPYLGYLVQLVRTPTGFALTFYLPGMILMLIELRNILELLRPEPECETRSPVPGVADDSGFGRDGTTAKATWA